MDLVIIMVALGIVLLVACILLARRWDKKNRIAHPDAPRVWFQMNRGNKRW